MSPNWEISQILMFLHTHGGRLDQVFYVTSLNTNLFWASCNDYIQYWQICRHTNSINPLNVFHRKEIHTNILCVADGFRIKVTNGNAYNSWLASIFVWLIFFLFQTPLSEENRPNLKPIILNRLQLPLPTYEKQLLRGITSSLSWIIKRYEYS